jgi:hypothetical protein
MMTKRRLLMLGVGAAGFVGLAFVNVGLAVLAGLVALKSLTDRPLHRPHVFIVPRN